MQVYLPDDLYRAVKDRGLPASDLLQRAVQAKLRRQAMVLLPDLHAHWRHGADHPSAFAIGRAGRPAVADEALRNPAIPALGLRYSWPNE
jgi:post-segregation antitoxin (ccd killing protein)